MHDGYTHTHIPAICALLHTTHTRLPTQHILVYPHNTYSFTHTTHTRLPTQHTGTITTQDAYAALETLQASILEENTNKNNNKNTPSTGGTTTSNTAGVGNGVGNAQEDSVWRPVKGARVVLPRMGGVLAQVVTPAADGRCVCTLCVCVFCVHHVVCVRSVYIYHACVLCRYIYISCMCTSIPTIHAHPPTCSPTPPPHPERPTARVSVRLQSNRMVVEVRQSDILPATDTDISKASRAKAKQRNIAKEIRAAAAATQGRAGGKGGM